MTDPKIDLRLSYPGYIALAREEAVVLTPYPDGQYMSIGIGHNGPDVTPESVLASPLDAFKLAVKDVSIVEIMINKFLKVRITQQEFDMLVLFAHNKRSLVENLTDIYNEGGDVEEVVSRLVTYNKNKAGKFILGLVGRRYREGLIGVRGDYGDTRIKLFTRYPGPSTYIQAPPLEDFLS